MADMARLYIFGDNTYETNSKLLTLLSTTGDPILAAFFDQAFNIIRAEAGCLPLEEFRNLPSFTSIGEIVAKHRDGHLSPAFQIALSTIYHLGTFIRFVKLSRGLFSNANDLKVSMRALAENILVPRTLTCSVFVQALYLL